MSVKGKHFLVGCFSKWELEQLSLQIIILMPGKISQKSFYMEKVILWIFRYLKRECSDDEYCLLPFNQLYDLD